VIVSELVMAGPLRISLKYRGRNVDDGTMAIDEVIEALGGFSGAYGKVASSVDSSSQHQLRVSAVEVGSFELQIFAVVTLPYLVQYADKIEAVHKIADAAKYVFGLVTGVMKAKKHIQGRHYETKLEGNNNTLVVVNADKIEMAIPPAVMDLIASRLIDGDLKKIAEPLEPERIEAVDVTAEDDSGQSIGESINTNEKDYFAVTPSEVRVEETEVIGKLISLNKERNKGTLKLRNNVNVPYRFVGEDREQFHADFSHKGEVKIRGIAELSGEDLSVLRIDIKSVHPIQERLQLPAPSEHKER
jgi:hypothetical protein